MPGVRLVLHISISDKYFYKLNSCAVMPLQETVGYLSSEPFTSTAERCFCAVRAWAALCISKEQNVPFSLPVSGMWRCRLLGSSW